MSQYSWHEDFFKRKVYPQICKDAGECAGLYAWIQVGDRQLYDEILRLEGEIDGLWKAKSDQESFRKACQAWYEAAMKGLEKWRAAMSGGNSHSPGAGRETRKPVQGKLI